MSSLRPQQVDYESKTEKEGSGESETTTTTHLRFDTEDIIALFAGIIALIFAFGMVFGKLPINELTIGVVGFSGVGAVIAEIIKARKRRKNR